MPEENHQPDQTLPDEDSVPKPAQAKTPYESIVSLAVDKIKDQPFLFVISIAGLLIGLTIFASGIGSDDLRFLVIVIAVLAFLVIAGYYFQSAWQTNIKLQREVWRHQEKVEAAKRRAGAGSNKTASSGQASSSVGISSADSSSQSANPKADLSQPLSDSEELLALHQRNLTRLLKKKAVYAAGEEPLSLLNQIENEEKEIQRLRDASSG